MNNVQGTDNRADQEVNSPQSLSDQKMQWLFGMSKSRKELAGRHDDSALRRKTVTSTAFLRFKSSSRVHGIAHTWRSKWYERILTVGTKCNHDNSCFGKANKDMVDTMVFARHDVYAKVQRLDVTTNPSFNTLSQTSHGAISTRHGRGNFF